MNDRGQTLHDYLLGITLVLLTVAAVFAFFPDVFEPFDRPVDEEDSYMADRLSEEVVAENAVVGSDRTVDLDALNRSLRDPSTFRRLTNRSAIPSWKQVNVTVRARDGEVLVAGESAVVGSVYREGDTGPTATRVRTIQAHNRSSQCAMGCQVVVRVWEGGS